MRVGMEVTTRMTAWASLDDFDLIRRASAEPEPARSEILGVLYARYYERVARWSLRLSPNAEAARDLAQEIFLRVHDRIGSFRFESKFSTWLYSVSRSVALNRRRTWSRRPAETLLDSEVEPSLLVGDPISTLETADLADRLSRAIDSELEPAEAKVVLLHYREGLTLNAITELLGFQNKSGAKAYLVSAKRKLRRHFESPDTAPLPEGRSQ